MVDCLYYKNVTRLSTFSWKTIDIDLKIWPQSFPPLYRLLSWNLSSLPLAGGLQLVVPPHLTGYQDKICWKCVCYQIARRMKIFKKSAKGGKAKGEWKTNLYLYTGKLKELEWVIQARNSTKLKDFSSFPQTWKKLPLEQVLGFHQDALQLLQSRKIHVGARNLHSYGKAVLWNLRALWELLPWEARVTIVV